MMGLTRNSSWRRGSRTAPFWLAALTFLSTGCLATKNDIRRVQFDIAALQQRQDSLYRDMLRQDRIVLDSLRRTGQSTRDVMADMGTRITGLNQQLDALQRLIGATQQQIVALRAELEGLRQQQQQATQPVTSSSSGNPEEMYQTATNRFNEKSFATARVIFQDIVRNHSRHPRAPDAQFFIAETFVAEEDYPTAYREFEQVIERWPEAPRAPIALYRAGVVAEEQEKNRTKAREYYNRVVGRFPDSDSARQAAARLRAIGRG